MRSDSALYEPRTNAEQSETAPKFRVTHESHGRDLYFIQVKKNNGPVKIGCANNVPTRLKTLQCGNHCELELLGTLPGRGSYEGEVHAFLRPCWLRGEWFGWSQLVASTVALLLDGKEDIDRVLRSRDDIPIHPGDDWRIGSPLYADRKWLA